MSKLTISLILALVVTPIILVALKFDGYGVTIVVFALAIALFFANLEKFDVFSVGKFSINATLRKQEENIRKEISESMPSWELLLEHDENGKQIEGSKGSVDQLIKAVQEGYPIKIRFDRSDGYFEVMDAQWLFVDMKKKLVHASNTSQVSIHKDATGNFVVPEKPYHYYVTVNNLGNHHARRVYVVGEEEHPKPSSPETRRMAWIGLLPSKEQHSPSKKR